MQTPTGTRVAVIGQGYVGLPVARAAVAAGHTVIGLDTDPAKVAAIDEGTSPIDDVTDQDLVAMLSTGRYVITDDPHYLDRFDVAVVTVPTPLYQGRPDLTAVVVAADVLGQHIVGRALVILESTVAPGTTAGAFTDALEASSGLRAGSAFQVAFSPERIDPGNTTWTFENTPKLVGGTTDAATQAALEFYSGLCDRVVPVARAEVAELAKLLENTYRHVNIALVNELAQHAHGLGIDIWDTIAAAATKPYGFQAFHPGPGVGGHCLPIDPVYLADSVEQGLGRPVHFIDLAMRINAAQPAYVVDRVTAALNADRRSVNGASILVLGLTYKTDSGDMRESPALQVVNRLADLGAYLHVCDPHVTAADVASLHVSLTSVDAVAAIAGAVDLVVLLTAHTDFPYEDIVRVAPRVLDTRGVLDGAPNVVKL